MSSIFLVAPVYVREDVSGRDTEYAEIDHDDFTTDIGYFISREEAQEWIDARNAEAKTRYDAAMAVYEPKAAAERAVRAEFDQACERLRVLAEKEGVSYVKPMFVGSGNLHRPLLSHYLQKYSIIEATKENP